MPSQPSQDDNSIKPFIEWLSKEAANSARKSIYPLLENTLSEFIKEQLHKQKQPLENLQKENNRLRDEIGKLKGQIQIAEGRASRLLKEISQIKHDGSAIPSLEILRITDELTLFRNRDFEAVAIALTKHISSNLGQQSNQPKFTERKNGIKSILAKSLFADDSIDNPDKIFNIICTTLHVSYQLEVPREIREKLQELIENSNKLKVRIKDTSPRGKLVIDPDNMLLDLNRHEVLSGPEESGAILSVVFPAYQPANVWVRAIVTTREIPSSEQLNMNPLSTFEQPSSSDNGVSVPLSTDNELSIINNIANEPMPSIPVEQAEAGTLSENLDRPTISSAEIASSSEDTNQSSSAHSESLSESKSDEQASHSNDSDTAPSHEDTNSSQSDVPMQPLVDETSKNAVNDSPPSNASSSEDMKTIPTDSAPSLSQNDQK